MDFGSGERVVNDKEWKIRLWFQKQDLEEVASGNDNRWQVLRVHVNMDEINCKQ